MRNEVLFSEIRLNRKKLEECQLVLESGNYRLYTDVHASLNTFYCVVVECNESWNSTDLVSEIFTSFSSDNKVRHARFGNNEGYVKDLNPLAMSEILQKINEIK